MLFRVFVVAWLLVTCGFYELSSLPDRQLMIAISLIMSLFIIFAWHFSKRVITKDSFGSVTSILISFSLGLIIGICYLYWHAFFTPELPKQLFDRPVIIQAQISELPVWQELSSSSSIANTSAKKSTRKKLRLQMKLKQSFLFEEGENKTQWMNFNGGLRAPIIQVNWYLSSQSKPQNFGLVDWPKLGDSVWLSVKLKQARGQSNPGAFDYDRYLFSKGILAKGYVKALSKQQWNDFQTNLSHLNAFDDSKMPTFNSDKTQVLAITCNSHVFQAADNIRTQLQTGLQGLFAESEFHPIVEALTLGERDRVSQNDWSLLRKTGTIHLMAISGLHIGLAALFGWAIFWGIWKLVLYRWQKIELWFFAKLGAIVCATFYAYLSGFSISTERAWIMVVIGVLFLLWQRPFSPWNAFFIALWLVMVFQPTAVLMQGFWLSFLAVAWIFIFLPMLANKSKWQQFLWIQLVLSLALLPALVFFFAAVPSFSFVANLIALPVVSFLLMPLLMILVLGLLLLPNSLHEVFQPLADLIDFILSFLWHWLEWVAAMPYSLIEVSSISVWGLVLIYGSAFSLMHIWLSNHRAINQRFSHLSVKQRNSWRHYLTRFQHIETFKEKRIGFPQISLLVLLAVGCFALFFKVDRALPRVESGTFLMTVLDVGQGLSVVVETQNKTLVYDLGAYWGKKMDGAKLAVLPYLKSKGINHIDHLVVSHSDSDHSGGLKTLIENIAIEQSSSGQPMILNQSLQNANFQQCTAGQNWQWNGVTFQVMAPLPKWLEQMNLSDNDVSCVLKVSTGRSEVWLMGDLSSNYEKRLLTKWGNASHIERGSGKNDISNDNSNRSGKDISNQSHKKTLLIAGHHGSRYSSGENWLNYLQPSVAVISSGFNNRFGFPHKEVLQRFENHNIQVFNTACQGALSFSVTPQGIELVNQNRIERTKWYYHSCFSQMKIE